MMFARNKEKKSFIDLIKSVNLFSGTVLKYYTFKLPFNTHVEWD